MSDPVVPASQDPSAPTKKKRTGKVLLIVAAILLVICGGGAFLAYKLVGVAVDTAYAEGNCVDVLPTSATAAAITPKAVSCSDSKAVAKILKVADGKTAADAESVCGSVPGATSFVMITLTGGSTKLLCLGPK
jgi:hypothetical protein